MDNRIIERITDKWNVWKIDSYYVVATRRRNIPVFKGTLPEAEAFMGQHPYGIPAIKAVPIEW